MAELKKVDSKAMLKELAKNKTKVKFQERKKVQIIEATKFYTKDQVINPHITWANQLIKDKIAKEVK